jgi:hypothetical protein
LDIQKTRKIEKVTGSRDDKKERVVVKRGPLTSGKAVVGRVDLATALSCSDRSIPTTALSFLSSRAYPEFPTSPLSTVPLMWFSLKRTTRSQPKRQLSTGNPGKPRDLQFRGPFLEMLF